MSKHLCGHSHTHNKHNTCAALQFDGLRACACKRCGLARARLLRRKPKESSGRSYTTTTTTHTKNNFQNHDRTSTCRPEHMWLTRPMTYIHAWSQFVPCRNKRYSYKGIRSIRRVDTNTQGRSHRQIPLGKSRGMRPLAGRGTQDLADIRKAQSRGLASRGVGTRLHGSRHEPRPM